MAERFYLRTLEPSRVLGAPVPDCATFLCLGQVSALLWQNKTTVAYTGEFYAKRISDGKQFQSARCLLPIEIVSHIKNQRFNVLISSMYINERLCYMVENTTKMIEENAPHVLRLMRSE